MPRHKPALSLPALALSMTVLLSGCGGSDTEPGSSGPDSGQQSGAKEQAGPADFEHISIFGGDAEAPSDGETVPLTKAGDTSQEIAAHEGMLFSYDNGSLFVSDYTTGDVPAGFPAESVTGLNTLYNGHTGIEQTTLPVAADGYLYFASRSVEGEPDDGEHELARFDLSTGLPEVLAITTEYPQITVHNEVLYYLADGLLTALDTTTGEELWQVDCDVEAMIDVVIAVGENAVGVMHTYTFDAFDLDDGTRIADRSADTWYLGLAAGPEGFYLAESRELSGSLRSAAADLHRISDTTGDAETIGATAATDAPYLGIFQMAVQDGTILVKSDFEIQALDEASGEMRWLATVRDEPYDSEEEPDKPYMELHATFDGDTVYAFATGEDADDEKQHRLLALDTASGETLANYDLDAGNWLTGPRLDGENLVFLVGNHKDPEHAALVLPKVR